MSDKLKTLEISKEVLELAVSEIIGAPVKIAAIERKIASFELYIEN